MVVKYLNPFLEAAAQVIKAELKLDIKRGAITVHNGSHTTEDVTVLINIVGQIQGVVLLELSKVTGLAYVSRMMGQTFSEFNNLAQSGIAELGNVITGQATIKLSKEGYRVDISPPTLIQGRNIQISTLDFHRIVVPIKTDLGEIVVHLALRESEAGSSSRSFVPLSMQR